MKRDFSQAQIEELWRIADRNQAELCNMAAEKFEEVRCWKLRQNCGR